EIKKHKMTTVIYASPHDLVKNLKSLNEALGDRKIAVVRELTKLHEEIIRCSLSEAIMHFKSVPPRGEFVLVIEGLREKKIEPDTARILSEINRAVESGMSNKDAIKTVSAEYGLKKTDVYKIFTTQE
ncbi:MAG TPA: 16S rRNA (cytidine(1402)-2'-O)-methyltransferase, partial [Clostridia bacterium]|nr:16S rRNA (cytidine(1402)-2'-O)-methyltransferase [Clostridia bacterium]